MTFAEEYLSLIDPVLEFLAFSFSIDSIVNTLLAVVPFAIGLVFVWWSVRRVTAIIMNAFRSGRLKI